MPCATTISTPRLKNRRREATRLADWFTRQAQEEQGLLNAADEAKTKYERENGIVMQADDTDVDTARLRALSSQGSGGAPMVAPMPVMTSQAAIQLAQLDAMIAQAAQNLGPNHPQMIELRARRVTLAQVAAQDTASARASQALAANAAGSGAGAMQRAVDMQTARVIAKRDKIQRLNQLAAEVKLRRDQYTKSITRVAELRQEAAIADTGITPLGDAVEPRTPIFPNKPLILGGSSALGLALGVLLSLLIEFFGRRVRSLEDLESTFGIPTLAVIAGPAKSNYPNSKSARGVFPAWLRRRPLARA